MELGRPLKRTMLPFTFIEVLRQYITIEIKSKTNLFLYLIKNAII